MPEIPAAERIGELVMDMLYGRAFNAEELRHRLSARMDVTVGFIEVNFRQDSDGIQLEIEVRK